MMGKNKKEELLNSENFMLVIMEIPKNTVEVNLNCKVYHEGEIHEMLGYFGPKEIRAIRNKYLELDPTDDAFAIYRLTDTEESITPPDNYRMGLA